MRFIVYGSLLILCCMLISVTEAQNRKFQRSKNVENDSGEKYVKNRKEGNRKTYKYRNDESNGKETYKTNRYDKQNCKGKGCEKSKTRENYEESDLPEGKRYLKYAKRFNKITEDSEEKPTYKKSRNVFDKKNNDENERKYDFKKKIKRGRVKEETEEDSEEEIIIPNKKNNKQDSNNNGKKQLRVHNRKNEDYFSQNQNKKYHKRAAGKSVQNVDDSEGDIKKKTDDKKVSKNTMKRNKKSMNDKSEEENVDDGEDNFEKKIYHTKINKNNLRRSKKSINDESEEKILKTSKKQRRDLSPPEDDSSEEVDENDNSDESNQDDESDENEEERVCRKKSKCLEKEDSGSDENSNESIERNIEPAHQKKIKYSVKFAHEKQRNAPTEDDNIMKKIHKGKKEYRFEEDEGDDFSEEHDHPKRIRYLDEDEE